jgi:S1-C subfamily serine protease
MRGIATAKPVACPLQNVKYNQMLYPVVQILGEENSGSGVLVHREKIRDFYVYSVLTNWHVVKYERKIEYHVDGLRGGGKITVDGPPKIGVVVFSNVMTNWTHYVGGIVAADPTHDLALVRFTSPHDVHCLAKIASPEQLSGLQIFDNVFAIGCQLAGPPIPTKGMIAGMVTKPETGLRIVVNTANILPGSSGGGLYKKFGDSYLLIGIPSAVQVYGMQIMSHYAFAISAMNAIEFLDANDYSFIYEGSS